jgi:hypothetical protein
MAVQDLISIDRDVPNFVREDAKRQGIENPVVLIMDCGCMMNQEGVVLDIKSHSEDGYEPYREVDGIKFFISPKVKASADGGRIGIFTYGAGRFKRLEFFPAEKRP